MRSSAPRSAVVSRGTVVSSEASAIAAATGMPGFTPRFQAVSLHAMTSDRLPLVVVTASGSAACAARA